MSTEQTDITLNDLHALVKIIDVCTKRGAFEGNEMEVVGTVRNKVAKFLEEKMPKEPEVTEESVSE